MPTCCICMDSLGLAFRKCMTCHGGVHDACLTKWHETVQNCPLCRNRNGFIMITPSEIIDLTFSDDSDEDHPPPVKQPGIATQSKLFMPGRPCQPRPLSSSSWRRPRRPLSTQFDLLMDDVAMDQTLEFRRSLLTRHHSNQVTRQDSDDDDLHQNDGRKRRKDAENV